MLKLPVSVIVNTYNEENNIKNCLESLKWADEILLVDMYSDDRTVEIARSYTDRILFHEKIAYVEPARKYGYDNAKNEWILIVDADELVPLKLKNKLGEIIEKDLGDVVSIPHNNYFFGYHMKETGWGALQDKHYRFYKKEFGVLGDELHAFLRIKDDARIYEIMDPDESFIHFNYVDIEHFLEKLNRYTTIEAQSLYKNGEDINKKGLIRKMFSEFKLRYKDRKGYKDGFQGFSLSLLMAMYRLATYSKLKLMKKYKTDVPHEKIREEYQKLADGIIDEYED